MILVISAARVHLGVSEEKVQGGKGPLLQEESCHKGPEDRTPHFRTSHVIPVVASELCGLGHI